VPRRRCFLGLLLTAGLATAACGDSTSDTTGGITVFAAASLTEAFGALGAAFTAEPGGVDVTLSFGGSSDLVAQIDAGAPADVFASADAESMDRLVASHRTAGQPRVFATNRLAILTAPGNPRGITGVADLADPDLVVVTCAAEVPCGAYASELFATAGVTVTARSLEENVKAVATKVTLGEADAGIVYATDVLAAGARAGGVEIPPELNVAAAYPITALAEANDPDTAEAFVDFVLGPQGQSILTSYGFREP
jgi:molybdate transport system substrate-binding protein